MVMAILARWNGRSEVDSAPVERKVTGNPRKDAARRILGALAREPRRALSADISQNAVRTKPLARRTQLRGCFED